MATGDKIYFAKKADLDKKLDNTTSASNADKLLSVDDSGNIVFDGTEDLYSATYTTDISLYVSPTGSDETGNGTEAKPFKTIQHAIDLAPIPQKCKGGHQAIIYVAAGTYDEWVSINRKSLKIIAQGDITIKNGFSARGNVWLQGTAENPQVTISIEHATNPVYIGDSGELIIQYCNLTLRTGGEHCMVASYNSEIYISSSVSSVVFDFSNSTKTTVYGMRAGNDSGLVIVGGSFSAISNLDVDQNVYCLHVFQNSQAYVSNCIIDNFNYGLYASSNSEITYTNTLTSYATTKTKTVNGRIYDNDWDFETEEIPTLTIRHAIKIPNNANLDDYQDIGEYYIASASNAATITNAPWDSSGCKITITDNYSGGGVRFMTAQAGPGFIAQRQYTSSTGWTAWQYLQPKSDSYVAGNTSYPLTSKAVEGSFLKLAGGTATGNITVNRADGTAGTAGSSTLVLGNSTLQSKAKNSRGWIQLYGTGNAASGATQEYYARLQTGAITAARYYTFGDRSGEVAIRDAGIDVSGCTLGSNIVKYGAIVCTKTNGVCTVVASLSCSAAIAQGATIFTLPSGYRPKSEMGSHPVLMTNSSGAPGGQAVTITTAGKVLVNNSCASGNRIYMTLTFLV